MMQLPVDIVLQSDSFWRAGRSCRIYRNVKTVCRAWSTATPPASVVVRWMMPSLKAQVAFKVRGGGKKKDLLKWSFFGVGRKSIVAPPNYDAFTGSSTIPERLLLHEVLRALEGAPRAHIDYAERVRCVNLRIWNRHWSPSDTATPDFNQEQLAWVHGLLRHEGMLRHFPEFFHAGSILNEIKETYRIALDQNNRGARVSTVAWMFWCPYDAHQQKLVHRMVAVLRCRHHILAQLSSTAEGSALIRARNFEAVNHHWNSAPEQMMAFFAQTPPTTYVRLPTTY